MDDTEDMICAKSEETGPIISKAMEMMKKMGYKEGYGLGKCEQGMLNPIECHVQIANQGLGMHRERQILETWTMSQEEQEINEEMKWLYCGEDNNFNLTNRSNWLKKDLPITTIVNEFKFCEHEVLINLLKAKQEVFETFNNFELSKARSKANPFETIKSAFFMNRAALKMANIDAATDFMFSGVDINPNHKKVGGPYYFADVCAGPGGFSEYMLWRKKWAFKGFGFTLKGEHDFKMFNSACCSDATFRSFYGSANDGNVCNPDNIKDFALKVMHDTENQGVHFMMADGGFSVEGNEELQEVLSKQIYVCQCLVALEIVRPHGHFVTKLFDTFTEFSVGLIFLMHQCFEKIAIFKPNTSRPANSERYLICSSLKDSGTIVKDVRSYLRSVVHELWTMSEAKLENIDIASLVPYDVIDKYDDFKMYITDRNNKLGKRQIVSLRKLAAFCKNQNLVDARQDDLRAKCLKAWLIPDRSRNLKENFTTEDLLSLTLSKPEFLYVKPHDISNAEHLNKLCSNISDWTYCPLFSSLSSNTCNIFAAIGEGKVLKLQNHKWVRVKKLKLIKGTLLYGELVTERSVQKGGRNREEIALHVIDAIRLGETSLADLPFKERLHLIRTYCKAINFETYSSTIRVRPKVFDCLENILNKPLVKYNELDEKYESNLSTLGYGNLQESYFVNSLLFLKTDDRQQFHTTYVLRAQLFIDKFEFDDGDILITYETLVHSIQSHL